MDLALLPFGTKSLDSILAWIMLAGVALAAAAVVYLLGRHHYHKRKTRKRRAKRP